MSLAIWFWILMAAWLILGIWRGHAEWRTGVYSGIGGSVLVFLLFLIVGWKVFGSPIKDD